MARALLSRPFQALIVVALCLVVALTALMMHVVAVATEDSSWPNTGTLKWEWPENCNASLSPHLPHPLSAVRGENYFTLHMFLMTLAFCLFAPLGAVWYFLLEDTLGLSHDLAKWTHAALQTAALLCSVLGFVQAYYSNGGSCAFANHFESVHSMVGIVLLGGWWLQTPLALLVFSNKRVLVPGTWARHCFLRAHVVLGKGMVVLALFVVCLGLLAYTTKRPQWFSEANGWIERSHPGRLQDIWNSMTSAALIAVGLSAVLGLVFSLAPQPPSAKTASSGPPLLDNAVNTEVVEAR